MKLHKRTLSIEVSSYNFGKMVELITELESVFKDLDKRQKKENTTKENVVWYKLGKTGK